MNSKVPGARDQVSGFWYCEPCGQRVVIGDTDSPARCPLCERRTAVFTATLIRPTRPIPVPLSRESVAAGFAAMRAAAGLENDTTGNPS